MGRLPDPPGPGDPTNAGPSHETVGASHPTAEPGAGTLPAVSEAYWAAECARDVDAVMRFRRSYATRFKADEADHGFTSYEVDTYD